MEAAHETSGPLRRLKIPALPLPRPRLLAIAAGSLILLLGSIGTLDLLAPSLPLSAFSLEGEQTVPAAFSAALLLGAGVLALLLGQASTAGGTGLWRFMGAFLVFMALDELFAIHERVSTPVTGLSWQVVYAPITVSAVIAWCVILRRLPSVGSRLLWVGGASAWFVSQVIEAVQWDGDRLVHEWTFVPEEVLEMTGSLLWGLALLLALRMIGRSDDDHAAAELPEPLAGDFRLRHAQRRRRARGGDRAGGRTGPTVERPPT